MSRYDYETSKRIAAEDPPFAALIMAAYRKADTANSRALEFAFPGICAEIRDRYNAPGGILAGDPAHEIIEATKGGTVAPPERPGGP